MRNENRRRRRERRRARDAAVARTHATFMTVTLWSMLSFFFSIVRVSMKFEFAGPTYFLESSFEYVTMTMPLLAIAFGVGLYALLVDARFREP